MTDKIELVAWKDHPLGGFRLYRKNSTDLWAAVIMDDPDTLTDNPQWDLQNWKDNMPDPKTHRYVPAADLYPTFYRMSNDHHGAWNVCQFLQDYLPSAIAG